MKNKKNVLNSVEDKTINSSSDIVRKTIEQLNMMIDFINNNFKTLRDFSLTIELYDKVTGIEEQMDLGKADIGPMLRDMGGFDDTLRLSMSFFNSDNNEFSDLREVLGFDKALQFVIFHEIAHYLDKLLKNDWLMSDKQDILNNSSFFKDTSFEEIVSYKGYNHQKTFDTKKAAYFLNKKLNENTADCWSVLLTSQFNDINTSDIIEGIKKVRQRLSFNNAYSTVSALDCLKVVNKNSTVQEKLLTVKEAAQIGMLNDLEKLFKSNDIKDVLLTNTVASMLETHQPGLSRNHHKEKVVEKIKSFSQKYSGSSKKLKF